MSGDKPSIVNKLIAAGEEDAEGRFGFTPLPMHVRLEREENRELVRATWDEFQELPVSELLSIREYLQEQLESFDARSTRQTDWLGKAIKDKTEHEWEASLIVAEIADLSEESESMLRERLEERGIDTALTSQFLGLARTNHLKSLVLFRLALLRRILWRKAVLGDSRMWEKLSKAEQESTFDGESLPIDLFERRIWALIRVRPARSFVEWCERAMELLRKHRSIETIDANEFRDQISRALKEKYGAGVSVRMNVSQASMWINRAAKEFGILPESDLSE